MRWQATHQTRFRYSQPVLLEPLTIRLQPRSDFRQRLLEFSLCLDPAPARQWQALDIEGNEVTQASFREPTAALTITTSFLAETEPLNPFDFLLLPEATQLQRGPPVKEHPLLAAYGQAAIPPVDVLEQATAVAAEADWQTLGFITGWNAWIHAQHRKIARPVGEAWEPSRTLAEACGSCRDLAMLFVAGCRALYLPARFISGYCAGDEGEEQELHAWAEVYLPGAGWRGFDPSLGLAIAERHLTVATGIVPAAAAPTTGSYRGEATEALDAAIELHAVEDSTACTASVGFG